jgi:outer membrane autotransporter protein
LDRDKTTFGDGFDSTVLGTTAGVDFRFNDMFLAGTAFNYVHRDGDFDGGGDFNTDSFGGLIFGSVMPIPAMFLDIALGYTRHDYDLKRSVEYVTLGGTSFGGNAKSDSDGDEFIIRAVAGYDYTIRNITVGPRVGLNYTHLSIDDYKESNAGGIGLEYDDQTVKSLQSTVGLQGSMAINTSYGVWVPQAMAEYVHEFENDRRSIDVQFVEDNRANPTKFSFNNDKPDRDFFNLGIGTVLVLPNGIQPFIDFRALVGNNRFDNYAGTVGIRIEGS